MRRLLLVLLTAPLLIAASACDAGSDPAASPPTRPSATAVPTTLPPTATPAPQPRKGRCYTLDFDAAISPTSSATGRACARTHTSETYSTGLVNNLVAGHLLAIDSDRVQGDVARICPGRLGDFVGGTVDARRLSMVKSVWFTPSLAESDAGARWFRCDAVVVAGADRLTPVTGSLQGALDTEQGRDRYGMCGTARPDDQAFQRVPCSRPHSWRAIDVVAFSAGKYPGQKAVSERGKQPCEDAGADVAADPLDYQWAYEGPDLEQWKAGQTFGRCWAPD